MVSHEVLQAGAWKRSIGEATCRPTKRLLVQEIIIIMTDDVFDIRKHSWCHLLTKCFDVDLKINFFFFFSFETYEYLFIFISTKDLILIYRFSLLAQNRVFLSVDSRQRSVSYTVVITYTYILFILFFLLIKIRKYSRCFCETFENLKSMSGILRKFGVLQISV